MATLQVGFLGAGPATQAIHLPVLATMRDRWRIASVMDVNPIVAEEVARRCGAVATTTADAVIDNPRVDVVAICSPHAFHAGQAIAACRAGKRAVLCEKPLAVSKAEATEVCAVAAETGTVVMVGTMHAFDPAYRRARAAWQALGAEATHVESAIYAGPNAQFVGLATEEAIPSAPPPPPPPGYDRAREATMLRATILALAIHDLPLVRSFMPEVGEVLSARRLPPFGYSLLLSDGRRVAELNAIMPGQWPPRWTFKASGADAALEVSFPPSYVLAGAAEATLAQADEAQTFRGDVNGYQAQWLHLHDILTRGIEPILPLPAAVADLEFAIDLADRAVACMEHQA